MQPMVHTLQHRRSQIVSRPKKKSRPKRMKSWQRMDRNLAAARDWYLKDRSFADAYLYVLTRWIEQTPLSIDNYPNLKKHRARMERDEGVKLALQRQNMEPVSSLAQNQK